MDAHRFGEVAKQLHASTNFEEVDAHHEFQTTGSLLANIDGKYLAVNGPNKSLNILYANDLSLVINLNTEN